jgi:signal transduction histidine kinase/HPt (histidine-containing phosphotransfer) domain-containing protein
MDSGVIKSVLENLNTLIYVSDLETNELLFTSAKLRETFGGRDLTGQICWQVLQSNMSKPCDFCPCPRLRQDPFTPIIWEEMNTANGCYYQNTDSAIQWDHGKIVHIQHSVDITDLKKAQSGMQLQIQQHEFLTAVSMDFASAGIFKDKIQNTLRLAARFLGVERASVLKHSLPDRQLSFAYEWSVHSENHSGAVIRWADFDPSGEVYHLLSSGVPVQINSIYDLPEPSQKRWRVFATASLAAVPIILRDNFWGVFVLDNILAAHFWNDSEIRLIQTLCGVVATSIERHEIETEIIERDIQLEKAIKRAEESTQAKSEFLSRMSHELRTPMNAIIGMTYIASNTEDPAKIKTSLSRIDDASKQVIAIINNILDMSKMESGQFRLTNKTFDLEQTLNGVVSAAAVKSNEKKQTLHMRIDKNVPKSYYGDELRLSQVLMNLLDNAVKFTGEEGAIQLDATLIGVENKKANLQFTVTDNGIGIPLEQQERLFVAFEQGNGGISRKYGGTGLGLSICKQIIQMMEGQIWVKSAENQGSQFTFNVKIALRDNDETPSMVTRGGAFHETAIEKINSNDKRVKNLTENTNIDFSQFLPFIDVTAGLARIRNNKKLYATMIKSFKKNDFFDEISQAVQNNDAEKAQYSAHTLKGVAGNLSLTKIYEIIVPIEAEMKHGEFPAGGLGELESAVQTTREYIDRLLAALESEVSS